MKLYTIEAGDFQVDGGAAFGVVPKRVWQKRYACNEDNFCRFAMRCLLIITDDKKILIDTGCGDKQLEYLKYYDFKGIINFENELAKFGLRCAEITDVVYTHLHFDHCGGSTKYNADKTEVELTFPNATHWVGKSQWDNFLHSNPREADSYFPENMLPIEARGKLKLISSTAELCAGVELRLFNGHTSGQIVTYISTIENTFVYVGDVIPIAASIPIAWVSAYDTFPIVSMEDKQIILQEAARENQTLIFEHDAYTQCCTIKEIGGKFRLNKSFELNDNCK